MIIKRRDFFYIAGGLVTSFPSGVAAQESHDCAMLARVLAAWQGIHAGQSAKALDHSFQEDGGISTGDVETYIAKECPYIKVDVQFASTPQDSVSAKMPRVIAALSKLYIEQPSID